MYDYVPERGELHARQVVSTLPEGIDGPAIGNSCAHIVVSPDDRFVYGSNRGHDSIAIWEVEDGTAHCGRRARVDARVTHRGTSASIRRAPGCSSRTRSPTPSSRFGVIRLWPPHRHRAGDAIAIPVAILFSHD